MHWNCTLMLCWIRAPQSPLVQWQGHGPWGHQPLSVASSGISSERATPFCKDSSASTQLLAVNSSAKPWAGWKGSVRTTGSQSLLWCVACWQRARLRRACGMVGVLLPRSLQSVREQGGTLPAALPEGIPAADQAGRTRLWTCSRPSQTMPGPYGWPCGTGCTSEALQGLFCPCWPRLSLGPVSWQWVRGLPKSSGHQRQSPSFPTHCICWHWGWVLF